MISALPPAPSRGDDSDVFVARADAHIAALPKFVSQVNALAEQFNLTASTATLGYLPPVPYSAGIALTGATQTVQYGEHTYAGILTALPFTTSGVFETEKFRLIQGVTANQLAEPDASSRMAYTAPGAGGVPSTIEKKLQQSASITDTGGVGDYNPATGTGVNCINALSQISARGPYRQIVRFPAILGQLNNYLLSYPGGYTVGAGSIVIDADPGVTIYTDSVVLGCDFLRPTRQVLVGAALFGGAPSLPITYVAQPHGGPDQPEADKTRWLNRGDIIAPRRKMIDPRKGWRQFLLTFPGVLGDGGDGAGFGGTTKVAFDESSVVINAAAGDGALHAGYTRLAAGDELGAHLDVQPGSTGYIPAAILRSATGYTGVLFGVQNCTSFTKRIGVAMVQRGAGSLGMGVHQSYSGFSAITTIRLLSAYRYQILVNGAVVYEGESPDPIQEAGFGGYIGGPCNFRWTDVFISRGHAPAAARAVGLLVIGDSLSEDKQGCWPRRCREALEGTYGVRVVQYHNQAVGGHDSGAQLNTLRANGVPSGTTDSVIQIGTNNIQGGSPVATLVAHVSEMIDIILAAGSRVVVGLPPLWYTQAQAGERGQASLNYSGGTPYRIALMRLCAERGIPLLDSLPTYGPIVANFVNPLQQPSLIGRDPMVFDNIHPGSYMAKIMGYAYAGLLLGQMAYVGTNAVPWTNVPSTWPVQNNWALDPTEGAQFRISDDGARRIRANYSTGAGATLTDGTTVQLFGPLLWPTGRPIRCDGYTPAGVRVLLVLGTDGQLQIYGAAGIGATQVYVDTGFYDIT